MQSRTEDPVRFYYFARVTIRELQPRCFAIFLLLSLLWQPSESVAVGLANKSADPQQEYRPEGPLVLCNFLPKDFIECEDPVDHKGNKTAKEETGYGCVKFGGSRYEEVEKTKVSCTVLPDIECFGPRTFYREGVPCIKYSEHYFATTLLYSILLGFLGMDRFCLGQTGTAVGKLLSLGGMGVWWIVDVILLVTNSLQPEDGSNWNPYV